MTKLVASKVAVSTTQHEWAHGRKPRGHGHWAFSIESNPKDILDDAKVFWFVGTYGKALRAACDKAAAAGVDQIYVMS